MKLLSSHDCESLWERSTSEAHNVHFSKPNYDMLYTKRLISTSSIQWATEQQHLSDAWKSTFSKAAGAVKNDVIDKIWPHQSDQHRLITIMTLYAKSNHQTPKRFAAALPSPRSQKVRVFRPAVWRGFQHFHLAHAIPFERAIDSLQVCQVSGESVHWCQKYGHFKKK